MLVRTPAPLIGPDCPSRFRPTRGPAGLDVLVDSTETGLEDGQPVAIQWVIARKL
jgi:hypothetical protein